MPEHFDTETLADHAEGVLDPTRDAQVRGHLASCDQCRDIVDQLAQVSTMLSSLPAPSMPADVSARIEASLANLQHERAGYVRGSHHTAGQPHVRRNWFAKLFAGRPQLLAGAAVLIVGLIFTGGYLATSLTSNGERPPSNTQTINPLTTGRTYHAATLAAQARALVADEKSGRSTPNPPAGGTLDRELRRLQNPTALAGCVTAVAGKNTDRIVAVDLSEFDGSPAAVVVMTVPDAPDKYEVAVVGPGCSARDPHIIEKTTVSKH